MMEKTMRRTNTNLFKWIMAACVLALGMQNAFALACKGVVHVKVPDDWTSANAIYGSCDGIAALKKQDNGWWTVSKTEIGYVDDENQCKNPGDTSFIITNNKNKNSLSLAKNINSTTWNKGVNDANTAAITCNGNEDIYISEGADGKPLISTKPPNAKFLYVVFDKEMEDWQAAIPMISMDGGKTLKALHAADSSKCGWYYYMWLDEEVTDNVMLVKDNDTERTDMIGLDGNWRMSDTPDPIPMSAYFDFYGKDSLFYVVDETMKENSTFAGEDGFSVDYPADCEGTCSYTMAAIIYDTDASLHPAFSCYTDGGSKSNDGCQEGVTGGPAAMSKTDALSMVYDCIGVTPGIVEENLDPTVPQSQRKPKLSTLGKSCFKESKYFDMLFNYTEGVNEVSCYDMPFSRSDDGKWEFNSDYYTSPGAAKMGGFYPVENTTDATVLAAYPNQVPVAAARTKRVAESPVWLKSAYEDKLDATEGVPLIDVYCKGPGWPNGNVCGGAPGEGKLKQQFNDGEYPSVWDWGSRKAGYDWPDNSKRNQHYCFESHAKFTYRPGLRFSFRGDDDIWVFIDNKLAVDLGGTHLAAPGYVDLDYFKGLSGKFESGKEYDLDVFFCDRRTTMSNVRIKTNMYIVQKTAISAKPVKVPGSKETTYEMCYTMTGDGSCASALSGSNDSKECCGMEAILNECKAPMEYKLVQGIQYNKDEAITLNQGQLNYNCIDLTGNNPKVDKTPGKCSMGPGRWTLFAVVGDASKKIETFRTAGKVDVMWADAQAIDTNGVDIKGGKYTFESTRMSGEGIDNMIPLYISAFVQEEGKKTLTMQPDDAIGLEYTLDVTPQGLSLFEKKADGSFSMVLASNSRKIGIDGVDTLYAMVPVSDMNSAIQSYAVKVSGGSNAATIKFFLPRIAIVDTLHINETTGEYDAAATAEKGAKEVQGDKANSDGSFTERWVGSYYQFYLMALKPSDDGSYEPCPECNFSISLGSTSSPSIQLSDEYPHEIVNGVGIVSIRSLKEYRFDKDPTYNNPAKFYVIGTQNSAITTEYNPIYFREPPVPFPVLADVFDVHGSVVPMQGKTPPSPYYSAEQEYLDGIGDSVAIYYNRLIPKDTTPHAVCIYWDSASAEVHFPKKEGLATIGVSDTDSIMCNALVTDLGMDNLSNCNQTYENNAGEKIEGYCDPVIRIGGLKLSEIVKTSGTGKVWSYTKYTEKGKDVMQGFDGDLTDRIAPIPLKAEVRSLKNSKGEVSGMDSMIVTMSEPVSLIGDDKGHVFDYYLNSAITLTNEASKFSEAAAKSGTIVDPISDAAVAYGSPKVKLMFKTDTATTASKKNTPHVGDFLHIGGGLSTKIWTDLSNVEAADPDGLRAKYATDDEKFAWNVATAYNETERLPSPWVEIMGDAEIALIENKFAHTGNGPVGENVPVVSVKDYHTSVTYPEVLAAEGGKPGHFIQADMYTLINGLDSTQRVNLDINDVYLSYKVEYFTNLGSFVASQSGKIYCVDQFNGDVKYFDGKSCASEGVAGKNFYLGWNMRSEKGRLVGTGAYIVKYTSYVQLGKAGKHAKKENTSVWGIKRDARPYEGYKKN
mgnify:CR=1 FL=1